MVYTRHKYIWYISDICRMHIIFMAEILNHLVMHQTGYPNEVLEIEVFRPTGSSRGLIKSIT